MAHSEHDPFAAQSEAGGTARSPVMALKIVGASLLVLVGAGLGVWALASNLDIEDIADATGMTEGGPGSTEVRALRPDLTSFSAVPGDRFVNENSRPSRAGVDIAPGVYKAVQVPDGDYTQCKWTVRSDANFEADSYYADGRGTQHNAVMVLPDGYYVKFDWCDTWEAIDPQELFQGATESVLGTGTHYVGRDLLPGTYLLARFHDTAHDSCFLTYSEEWGFTGPAMRHAFLDAGRYPALLHLEEGHTVGSSGCPELHQVDFQELLSQELGEAEFTDGGWVVGVDVLPGTYVTADEIDEHAGFCKITAWNEGALQSTPWETHSVPYEHQAVVSDTRHPGGPLREFTLDPGQTVHSFGCGTVTRVGD